MTIENGIVGADHLVTVGFAGEERRDRLCRPRHEISLTLRYRHTARGPWVRRAIPALNPPSEVTVVAVPEASMRYICPPRHRPQLPWRSNACIPDDQGPRRRLRVRSCCFWSFATGGWSRHWATSYLASSSCQSSGWQRSRLMPATIGCRRASRRTNSRFGSTSNEDQRSIPSCRDHIDGGLGRLVR